MGEACSSSRIFCFLMLVFLATTIALAAYLIYDKVKDDDDTVAEATVEQRYPGYFRTIPEQVAFEKQIAPVIAQENATSTTGVNNTKYDTCDFLCRQNFESADDPSRPQRSVDTFRAMVAQTSALHTLVKRDRTLWRGRPVYHGCCISRHKFVSPPTLPNKDGEERVIVQFKDRRQYFLTQECKHARGCTGCTCRQEQMIVTAVVENIEYPDGSDEEYVLEFVKLGGCCKCFN